MKKAVIIITALAVAAAGAVGAANFLHIKPEKLDTFAANVRPSEELTVPETARVIALGEATHGNSDFQQLKLTVFKRLVETTNVRGLILEGDMGGCARANEYINGGKGTAEEVTRKLGYQIYRTDDMCELIQWMHDYNETAPDEDKVRLYGADIQRDMWSIELIKGFYEEVSADKYAEYSVRFDELFGTEEDSYDKADYDEIVSFIDEVGADMDSQRTDYEAAVGKDRFENVRRADEMLKCYMEYREKENFSSKYRDTKMKENVEWALSIEENDHGSRLMLSCHNGHMTKNQSSMNTFMGKFLYDELGEGYFAIGTDFYISNDDLPVGSDGREVHKFISDDPLAYQAGELEGDSFYMDFSQVAEDDPIYKIINKPMKTGSLGEQYNILIQNVKPLYQLNKTPTEMYDAMIFIYETDPIEVWDYR
ncbi:erythromycin esterase family protein [Ruminococcus sp.]|uniref:erythromycin esterase family protein n=1 Tax=Ruminococcus sp. TaxID=41978 RepID=UPI0025D4EBA7|nr:erythromycin esterase family protein [Ruminococcus sp.]MBQ8967829.1 erythromycin esterase family protein [Ruminococcus sp.]